MYLHPGVGRTTFIRAVLRKLKLFCRPPEGACSLGQVFFLQLRSHVMIAFNIEHALDVFETPSEVHLKTKKVALTKTKPRSEKSSS